MALQRDEGIKRALEVTRLLGVASGLSSTSDAALAELKVAASELNDPKMTQACASVERTMAQLNVLLSRAAGSADAEEFDKVRGAVEAMVCAMRKSAAEATEEAASAILVKTVDASDEAVGIARSAYGFRVPRLVEDTIVLVADGRALAYDRGSGADPWRPISDADVRCNCAHALSGGRTEFVSKYLHASPDGRHHVTLKHKLCRVDGKGVGRVLPGKLTGTCILRVGGELVAVGDDGVMYREQKGRWDPVFDSLPVASAAVAYDRIVVVTKDGRVLAARIDDDLSCLNEYTPWTAVPDTEGLGATSVGFRAPAGMTLSHPDGRTMRVTEQGAVTLGGCGEELVVRASRPELLHNVEGGYVALDVHSGPGAGCDSLMHFDYCLYSRPFRANDFAYAWKLIKSPQGGYFVYNDFAANSWLGHDRITDAVVIVNADSVDRVSWTIRPDPSL
jgi:hypothetical protein